MRKRVSLHHYAFLPFFLDSSSSFHAPCSPVHERKHAPKQQNDQALVIVEIKYNPPDDYVGGGAGVGRRRRTSGGVCVGEGNYDEDDGNEGDRTMKTATTEQQSSKSFDDDQQMLLDIQQNIQNLERTLSNKGKSGWKF